MVDQPGQLKAFFSQGGLTAFSR